MASKEHDPKEQPLVAHLMELRDRLMRCCICVLVVFLAMYYFSDDLFHFVFEPLKDSLTGDQKMITTKPLDSFMIPLMMTLMLAFFASIPYIMHQVWGFVAPGLYQNEIRVTMPILVSSVTLFYVGLGFARFLVLPLIFNFTSRAAPTDVTVMNDISNVYDLITRMFFVFGFVFEIPVATILLILAGVVDPDKLKKHRGYVVIGCFTIGMIVTPPDVLSQTMVAVPMWMLFEAGLFFGRILKRKSPKADEAKAAS